MIPFDTHFKIQGELWNFPVLEYKKVWPKMFLPFPNKISHLWKLKLVSGAIHPFLVTLNFFVFSGTYWHWVFLNWQYSNKYFNLLF